MNTTINTTTDIVLLDAETLGPDIDITCLQRYGNFTSYTKTDNQKQAVERSRDAQIILVNKVLVDKKFIDKSPNLKLVCVTATGMNNVDLDYARQKNITVKNVSNYSTRSVAQHTFSSLLALISKLDYYDNFIKSGDYSRTDSFVHYGPLFNELAEKTFGIIGMGNIGKAVAKIADAFGSKVVYYSSSGEDRTKQFSRLSLEELLQQSDFVSIHSPLDNKTANLIQMTQLQQMKKTAILINMGRGGIVDETALAKAIDEEIIAGAVLDVFAQEPLPLKSPLLSVAKKDNMLFTPHIAWASIESRKTLVEKVCKNIEEFLGKEI